MNIALCPWDAPTYLFFSGNIPTLFFYSHIPAMIIAMVLGIAVFSKNTRSAVARSLLVIVSLFFVWGFADLILWATNDPSIVMFYWSLQILIEPLIFLMSLVLSYRFIFQKEPPFTTQFLAVLALIPLVVFLPTKHTLVGVNLADCTAIEGFFAHYYSYVLETASILLVFVLVRMAHTRITDIARRKEVNYFATGIILFLLAFSWGNIIGSFSANWTVAQFGLIGMPIFVGYLSYLIVKFRTFNIKLISAQVLVFALGFLVLSMAFLQQISSLHYVVYFTLVFVLILGNSLIKSVKREISQREHLELLTAELEASLRQRESLTHLITHKIKGVLARSKAVFSEMIEGTFGALPPMLQNMAKKGLDSDNEGVQTVDLVLNASNLSKGTIKFDMKPVDFKAIVEKVCEEKKPAAETKHLAFEIKIEEGVYTITGDVFWLTEAVRNLIENAIRYTPSGKITVSLKHTDSKKMLFSVQDTGVGITPEDMQNLFKEGGRGKDSVKINVDSTGYGLYTVKLIVDAHHGHVWAESVGIGNGTTFYVELIN